VSDHTYVPKSALDKGSDVHALIAAMLDGKEYIPQYESSYLLQKQAQAFLTATGAGPIVWETRVCDRKLGYAGTIDLICELNGDRWILDWKCGGAYAGNGAQLAAYFEAWNRMHCKKARVGKYGIVILTEKSWKIVRLDLDHREHRNTFKDALAKYCKNSPELFVP
jgi:hypothetical protein